MSSIVHGRNPAETDTGETYNTAMPLLVATLTILAAYLIGAIPFGFLIGAAWKSLYLFGFLYFLAPLLALFLIFLPLGGAGFFGLRQGPMFTLYLLLVNLPFGIVTALAARAIIGLKP